MLYDSELSRGMMDTNLDGLTSWLANIQKYEAISLL
jgi:hypothetical protein